MDTRQFESRKREHIRLSLNSAHQAIGLSGLDRIRLVHEALPDLNFDEIRLNSTCLGLPTLTPFYVAGMTAGHEGAYEVNRTLALACQEKGWCMGVGSQRRDLESSPGEHGLDLWRRLREEAPDLILFANIGISQLISVETTRLRTLVKDLNASALVVHVNGLQEVMQPEGTPRFRGGLAALKRCCEEFDFPVILKETGCGFSAATLQRISSLGLAAVDVSGLGGTHWGRIEGARAEGESLQAIASQTFADWGEPTVESVLAAVENLSPQTEIWASGGVRTGLAAAKLMALGAHRIGYAKPALEAALEGPEKLRLWMAIQEFELRTALFCTGSESIEDLRKKERVWKISAI